MVEGKGQGDLWDLSYHTSFAEREELRSKPQLTHITRKRRELTAENGQRAKQDPSKQELMGFRVGGRV